MCRCRACDKTMTDADMRRKNPITLDFEDFCGVCLSGVDEISAEMEEDFEFNNRSVSNE